MSQLDIGSGLPDTMPARVPPVARRPLWSDGAERLERSLSARLTGLPGLGDVPERGELAELRPATRLMMIGLAAWCGLVVVATLIAIASVEISSVSVPNWLTGSALSVAAERAPKSFDTILSRPLFSRNRQVEMAVQMPAPLPPPPPVLADQNFILKGVFLNGATGKAFLATSQNPLGEWVEVNQDIAGWRVAEVQPEHVVLEGQSGTLIVQLSINGGSK